jgi:Cft2 family RNA processing exonuclease
LYRRPHLYHLKLRLPDPANTVLFVGYQAQEQGRWLVDGEKEVRIHGEWVPVGATVRQLGGLSAHADADELIAWLSRRGSEPLRCAWSTASTRPSRLRTGCRGVRLAPRIPDLGDVIEV